jgi:hypothetical protein
MRESPYVTPGVAVIVPLTSFHFHGNQGIVRRRFRRSFMRRVALFGWLVCAAMAARPLYVQTSAQEEGRASEKLLQKDPEEKRAPSKKPEPPKQEPAKPEQKKSEPTKPQPPKPAPPKPQPPKPGIVMPEPGTSKPTDPKVILEGKDPCKFDPPLPWCVIKT